jgi:threonine aldolase
LNILKIMENNFIDLRSDTVTKPTAGMLQAMFAAPVGDDVFGEDPSINNLETEMAKLFGMEAALFCPTGTMSNQIAIACHTTPGNEVICEAESHVFYYEGGGIARNSFCQTRTIAGNQGKITAEQIQAVINPDDVHKPITKLVSLENTCNRGGGSTYTIAEIEPLASACKKNNLILHLDGARLWNALIYNNETPAQHGNLFDSISVCFNKGMGCPTGSILLGTKQFIYKARRQRKVFGGGMRQAGYLAAACSYALKHNFERIQVDHNHAQQLKQSLETCSWVKQVLPVYTNIVLVDTIEPAETIVQKLAAFGVLCFATAPNRIRFVTHLHLEKENIHSLTEIFQKI